MTWYLDNICKRNKKSPYLFYVPSEQEIDSLKLKLGKVIFFVTEAEEDAYCRGGEYREKLRAKMDSNSLENLITNDAILRI
ncbi:hypothetical protein ACQKK2_13085 [Bacillus paranthracis]|uniref:hypothetical protein n=1 Tax=Bacillus cereus group TaxID=86661 RepID=UPI000673E4D8|nr:MULTISPECIES: hypothetical protein [Bacillus cereus group]MCY9250739.1 hypothetical protein [Bacillus paranthracis]MDA1497811.1 hypothetical protein [Bacillus cereus group sp. TH41-1LC]MDA1684127.1 hypothetical protein [Bacillus cereus group sp. m2-21]MDA1695326.1 hypothetical protein [Bacillus cereus group sp. m1-2]MDA1700396.1 hypothetical protein [Bacillus cereus group sp. m1-16]